MHSRQLVPEKMDDPDLDPEAHVKALRGLQRINRWTGNAGVALRPLLKLARELQTDSLSLLDVATGSGDVPVDLYRLGQRRGLALELTVCDISPTALAVAEQGFRRANVTASCFQANILTDELEACFDVVLCTTFLHHLTRAECIEALRKMGTAAKHRVVVVDLVRSRLNWWQVWVACHALSRSKIVHFDGPQSVRASFTIGEITELAKEAGLREVKVQAAWPCRFVLEGSPPA